MNGRSISPSIFTQSGIGDKKVKGTVFLAVVWASSKNTRPKLLVPETLSDFPPLLELYQIIRTPYSTTN